MTDALKPCPFCGNQPWGIFGPREELGSCWVECHTDPATQSICGDWHFTGSREETAAAWNRRAAPAVPPGEPVAQYLGTNGGLPNVKLLRPIPWGAALYLAAAPTAQQEPKP